MGENMIDESQEFAKVSKTSTGKYNWELQILGDKLNDEAIDRLKGLEDKMMKIWGDKIIKPKKAKIKEEVKDGK